jgi:DNA invertase Pin-like site-specific DNA recombinase
VPLRSARKAPLGLLRRPDGATMADKMLFMVAAMAAEMERDLIRERTLDGLRAAQSTAGSS